jgi:hypothetical protein
MPVYPDVLGFVFIQTSNLVFVHAPQMNDRNLTVAVSSEKIMDA